jgi:outer membrane protein OmpA-like peptidoglycan-associated protein
MRFLFILLISASVITSRAELITQIIHFDHNSAFLSAQERDVLRELLPQDERYFIEKIDIDGYCGMSGGEAIAEKRAKSIYKFLTTMFPDKGDYEIRIAPEMISDVESSNCATIRVYYLHKSSLEATATSVLFPEEFPEEHIQYSIDEFGRIDVGEILFHGNSAIFLENSIPQLDRMIQYLSQHPKKKILLVGHVNGRAGRVYLKKAALTNPERKRYNNALHLSTARAQSVKDFLVTNGIASDRVLVEGMGGKQKQIVNATNELEEEANRRLEVFDISEPVNSY